MATPYEEHQHDLNPHRDEDQARAAQVAAAQLRQRGIDVEEDEPVDALADLVTAAEHFEEAVSLLGGDRMTNAPDSEQPDDARLVLPRREKGEAVADYAGRVRAAAQRLLDRAGRDAGEAAAMSGGMVTGTLAPVPGFRPEDAQGGDGAQAQGADAGTTAGDRPAA